MTVKSPFHAHFDLTGKIAVVTGGTGILGRVFCAGLAEFGASVAVVDLSGDACDDFAEELTARYEVRCIGVKCDVGSPNDVAAMTELVESSLGPIDILHNNAATKGSRGTKFFEEFGRYDLEDWREIMRVNLDGFFLVAQAVGPLMATRGKGSIIQTSSIYGMLGPDQRIYIGSEYDGRPINTPAVYSASKAGVIGLTRYLAAYWGHRGVRVNTLVPGGVRSGQNDAFIQNYSARVPLGRMARAEEMVGTLVYLASDASSYVTGQALVVDGGLSVW